jgi:hypothetical protein
MRKYSVPGQDVQGWGMRGEESGPPSGKQIRAALRRLPCDPGLAGALHLALPVGEVPSIAVRHTGQGFTYRGQLVRPRQDYADLAAEVARAGHMPSDCYLDLSGAPSGWAKVLRTGTKKVMFGAQLLFGAPRILLEPSLGEAVGIAILETWLDGSILALPSIVTVGTERVLVAGTRDSWVVFSAPAATASL